MISASLNMIGLFYCLLHAGLCSALIFGWWIFPAMGVEGAAVTNVVTQRLGLMAGIWILTMGRTRLHLSIKGFRAGKIMIWRIIRICIPVAVTGAKQLLCLLDRTWTMEKKKGVKSGVFYLECVRKNC